MSNETHSAERKIHGRDLSQSSRGTIIVRSKNGYRQPGRILDIIPIITDPSGVWLTKIEWAETPAANAYVENVKIPFDTELTITGDATTKPAPGTAAVELVANPEKYASPPEGRQTEVFDTDLTQSGPYTRGRVELTSVRADELSPADIGHYFQNGDEATGANYHVKLLNYRVVQEGRAPGVTVWLRHSEVDARPAYENHWHVPMDHVFNFVVLTPQV
ncbi:hypothetical protein [Nocardia gamkensis]|uniref:hypothetical protein n=1 Tax=Nocardia gamkensis TaxID=352869 RepID=UPI0037C7D903